MLLECACDRRLYYSSWVRSSRLVDCNGTHLAAGTEASQPYCHTLLLEQVRALRCGNRTCRCALFRVNIASASTRERRLTRVESDVSGHCCVVVVQSGMASTVQAMRTGSGEVTCLAEARFQKVDFRDRARVSNGRVKRVGELAGRGSTWAGNISTRCRLLPM